MKKSRKQIGSPHYRDDAFLQKLGEHCKRLRIQKGYSIDRMSREGDQLSPSVIHRLETGAGNSSIATLCRYAEILRLPLTQLINVDASSIDKKRLQIFSLDAPEVKKEAFKTLVPLYSLKAAAGVFGSGEDVEALGWLQVSALGKKDTRLFAARAVGHSMEPMIQDGDFLLFRANPEGTRQNKIVLAQYHGASDPETGGSYTVKKYISKKSTSGEKWKHTQITLQPLNPKFNPIVLAGKRTEEFVIVAELVRVLGQP